MTSQAVPAGQDTPPGGRDAPTAPGGQDGLSASGGPGGQEGVSAPGGPGGVFADPRLTAMGLLAETYAGLMAKFVPGLSAAGLAATDFDVLLRLARSAGRRLRMTDLATQTALSTSGITRVVDRLEQRGLVTRETCPSDRRGSYAVLTAPGRDLIGGVLQRHVRDIDRWFTGLLTAEQLNALLSALRVVRDEVRPGATAGALSAARRVCVPGDHGDSGSSRITSL